MIELVISIVVIGIVVMTLPLIINQSVKSSEFSLNGDAFFKAQSLMKAVMGAYWDKQAFSLDSNGNGYLILDTVNGDTLLARSPDTNSSTRKGYFPSDFSARQFYAIQTFASTIPSSSSSKDAIEEFNGFSTNESGTNISVSVAYVSDSATQNGSNEHAIWNLNGNQAASSTNLKRVNITATKSIASSQTNFELVYFSSNIGSNIVPAK